MPSMIRRLACAGPLLLLAAPAAAREAAPPNLARAALPALALQPADAGQPDPLLTAVADELQRIQRSLADQPEPPYWMQLALVDRRVVQVQATHGAAVATSDTRERLGDIALRLGDPTLDNTHKIRDAGWFSEEARPQVELPVGNSNLRAVQMGLWRAADESYRSALRRLMKVRTNDAVKVAREDQSADFSDAPVVQDLRAVRPVKVDAAAWQRAARDASAVLLDYPHVYDSNVTFRLEDDVHLMTDTDGTAIRFQRPQARVSIWATTVAEDGMELGFYDYVDVSTPSRLPDAAALIAMAHRVGQQVEDLREAPLVDPYSGPAILRGRAAAVFFHEILGHRVEGHRQKDEDEGQTLADKVGEEIFPTFLSVHDDPTLFTWEGEELSGYYPYDDEGVAAQRVDVVEDGVLRGFLMSRAPIDGFGISNGHGRRQPGSAVVARQGNLVVSATQTVPYDQLREQLVQQIRDQGKPFGLILDDISGGFTLTGRTTPNSYAVQPVTAWRVFPDGRPDELVRGIDMIGTPLVTFQKIVAASDDTQVFNGVCGAESGWVPVSAIAPDLLVEEVEVQRQAKENDRPPLLPPPGIREGQATRGAP